ncbi:MAG: hypothetical protein GX800_09860 [Clostridiaceae bacterium]|jgi:hypothetical protein|nr:hypothetical protein [Clostridiaceae bacterium]
MSKYNRILHEWIKNYEKKDSLALVGNLIYKAMIIGAIQYAAATGDISRTECKKYSRMLEKIYNTKDKRL